MRHLRRWRYSWRNGDGDGNKDVELIASLRMSLAGDDPDRLNGSWEMRQTELRDIPLPDTVLMAWGKPAGFPDGVEHPRD